VPILLLVIAVAGSFIFLEVMRAKFAARAEQFDLDHIGDMESASILYDRDGKEFGKIYIQNRHPVDFDQFPKMLINAVIAAEDNRFYDHGGVDYMGIARAMITNYRKGRIAQGASTVTQQLARNSFDLKERTYERKIVEVFLAQRIEKRFPKDKIMELYLNRVYFGSGLYGAESAARGYFGIPAKEMNAGQCAMIAGMLKAPNSLSPWGNHEGATNARNFVLGRMKDLGFLSKQQYREAVDEVLLVRKRGNPFNKTSYPVDFARLQAIAALGYERAMNGGFRIYTTLDSDLQRASEQAMRRKLDEVEATPGYDHETYAQFRERVAPIEEAMMRGKPDAVMPPTKYLQGAALAIDNHNGGILAMVGGRDFRHSEYNRALQSKRPAGTAFAPIVFAAAYDKGIFPGEIVQDACMDNRYVMVGGATGILGEWGVESADNDYEGPMTTRDALVKGKNAATVRLGMRVGLDAVKQTAAKLGIRAPLREYTNSFLGTTEQTLEELTLAYSAFPTGGERPSRTHIIERITDPEGHIVYQSQVERTPAISPQAAYQMHSVLADVLKRGTGADAYTHLGLEPFPAGGKTGTAYNFTDTYFIGYDSAITCGVWIGYDLPGKIYRGAFGKDLALPVWTQIMNRSQQKFPGVEIARPEGLRDVEICRVSGLLSTPRCKVHVTEAGTGREGESPTTGIELATESEVPQIRCDVHGGGIRNYAKDYEQEDWPRAANAVDLATIRPVGVASPTLLGFSDVYNSVSPSAHRFEGGEIPVARAVAANGATPPPVEDSAAASGQPATAAQKGDAVPAPTPTEVRKAEAAGDGSAPPLDQPVIPIAPPAPMQFQ